MPRKRSEDGSRPRGKYDSKFEFRNPGNNRQARAIRKGEGIQPSAKDVALAVIGGHISRAEAQASNRHYAQWIPEGTKIPRKKAEEKPKKETVKKPKKKRSKPKVLSRSTRIVNGKKFKVTKLAEDTKATAKNQAEIRQPRIGRGKGRAVQS